MVKKLYSLWMRVLFLCVVGFPFSANAAVTATLDRTEITFGETVRLIIESDSLNNNSQPDYSDLKNNFQLLGTSTSQNISFVNGQQTSSRQWVTELDPKEIGSFTLPSIKVGSEQTQVLRLNVLPSNSAQSATGRDMFVEIEINEKPYYVQQQIIASVKLYLGVSIIDGSLPDLAPENTDVRRLGQQDRQFSTTVNGREYTVIERRFALFPGNSGELLIPPIRFHGVVQGNNASGNQIFGSIFNQGKRVSAKSNSLTLTILPPAPGFVGRNWLPAKYLAVSETNQNATLPAEYMIGQPFTKTIEVNAVGLTAEQIPDFEFSASADFKLYPDKTERQSTLEGEDINGKLTQSFAIIPSSEGALTLPEIKISWWNTESNQMEVATLPENVIHVNANVNANVNTTASSEISADNASSNDLKTDQAVIKQPEPERIENPIWRWISAGMGVVWLLTILCFLKFKHTLNKQKKENNHSPQTIASGNSKALLNQLKDACRINEPQLVRARLHTWLKSVDTNKTTPSLESLVDKINAVSLSEEINILNQNLYHEKESGPWSGEKMLKILQKINAPASHEKKANAQLPSLYPN